MRTRPAACGRTEIHFAETCGSGFIRIPRLFGHAVATGRVVWVDRGADRIFSRAMGRLHKARRNLQPARMDFDDSHNYVPRWRATSDAGRDRRIPEPRLR